MSIDKPGIYDLGEEAYHADPVEHGSLSASSAKYLLPPHVPADYLWYRQNRPTSKAFDFGHAVHSVILGVGGELVTVMKATRDKTLVPADGWTTVSAQKHAEEIRAEGGVPVLESDRAVIDAMAEKVREHPVAHALLTSGEPERSAFWCDPDTGVWRRCRYDILPDVPEDGRLIIPDYKTTSSVDPDAFNRKVIDFGYDLQAANYIDTAAAILGLDDVRFVFVAQLNKPPFHVAVIEPSARWITIGRERFALALRTYKRCRETGDWPAYPDPIAIAPPAWVDYAHDDLMAATREES